MSFPEGNHLLLCVLCLVLSLFLQSCNEGERIYLYDQFYYAQPLQEIKKLTSAEYCRDDRTSLCRKNPVPFFRASWYQRFLFRQERLVGVQLIHLDPDKARKLIDPWLDGGYHYLPVAIRSAGKELDLFAEIKTVGKEGARKAVNAFSRATATDQESTYIYVDLTRREHILDSMFSFHTILASGPRDLLGIEEKVNNKMLSINFFAPVAEWQDQGWPKP
ncbi:MAG: hypothetical protein IK079_00855 [Desulfovibrio sp.]|nr:hypothetical protein [Desulfovibrio sp.]